MKFKAIITGDIVNSSKILGDDRTMILEAINELPGKLNQLGLAGVEIYRGDSFQMIIELPENAVLIAILTRALLRSKNKKWDVRIAIGVGTIEYNSTDIITSDGEAYKNSGREFDILKKRRLSILTPWSDVNDELAVSTPFADNIISNWSNIQANVIFISLLENITQREIAERLGKKNQSVNNVINSGKESLISMYITRYCHLINSKIKSTL